MLNQPTSRASTLAHIRALHGLDEKVQLTELSPQDIDRLQHAQEARSRATRIPGDRLARFSDADLFAGLARLFRETKLQTCTKCNEPSRHKTCDFCRGKARKVIDDRRCKAQRSEARRIERRAA